jgi:hypothetical protein
MPGNPPTQVVTSAARTTTGNSGALSLPAYQPGWPSSVGEDLAVLIDVTAVSGTPNLVLSVEWSLDAGVTFAQSDPADQMTAITTASTKVKTFQIKAPVYRLVWTITGGTPSLTFSIATYATT